jgi:hypothetical protein
MEMVIYKGFGLVPTLWSWIILINKLTILFIISHQPDEKSLSNVLLFSFSLEFRQ